MHTIIISTSLLSICFLSSCSTIKGYRQDPDTWGKKGNKEKTEKVTKTAKLPNQKPVAQPRPVKEISANAGNHSSNNANSKTQQGRTVGDFLEPTNVTKLPDNKELQESTNVAPASSPPAPKLEAPVAPTTPLLIDPTEPLPSIDN